MSRPFFDLDRPGLLRVCKLMASVWRPVWWVLVLAMLGHVAYSAFDAWVVQHIQPLVDQGLVARDMAFIQTLTWKLPVLFAARGTLGFGSGYAMHWLGRRLTFALRQRMMHHLVHLPVAFFAQQHEANVLSRLTFNVEQFAKISAETISQLVREGGLVLCLLGLMFWTHARLTLLFMLVFPPMVLLLSGFSRYVRRAGHRLQGTMGRITHLVQDMTDGHRVIRLFNSQAVECQRFDAALEQHRIQEMKLALGKELSVPLVQWISGSAFAWSLYWALTSGQSHHFSAGDFTVICTAMLALLKPVKQLSALHVNLQQGLAAAEDIFAWLDTPMEPDTGRVSLPRVQGHVQYHDVSFGYHQPLLERVSWEAHPGQTIAFVGPSGAGKTTLLHLLPRFYNHTGTITLDGVDIRSCTLESVRQQIAVVSQHTALFEGSVTHNIAYGDPAPDIQRLQAAAEAASARDFIEALPEGFDTWIGKQGMLLSGGQRQRLAIARALYRNAPVLILDEATASLDTDTEYQIQRALLRTRQARTTLVITHRLSTVMSADWIYVMAQGRIVEQGRHEQLMAQAGLYAHLHKTQFQSA